MNSNLIKFLMFSAVASFAVVKFDDVKLALKIKNEEKTAAPQVSEKTVPLLTPSSSSTKNQLQKTPANIKNFNQDFSEEKKLLAQSISSFQHNNLSKKERAKLEAQYKTKLAELNRNKISDKKDYSKNLRNNSNSSSGNDQEFRNSENSHQDANTSRDLASSDDRSNSLLSDYDSSAQSSPSIVERINDTVSDLFNPSDVSDSNSFDAVNNSGGSNTSPGISGSGIFAGSAPGGASNSSGTNNSDSLSSSDNTNTNTASSNSGSSSSGSSSSGSSSSGSSSVSSGSSSSASSAVAPALKGTVFPLKSVTLVNHQIRNLPDLLIRPTFASTCSAVTTIHEIDSSTSLPNPVPLQTMAVKPDATYQIDVDTNLVDITKPTKYLIKVSGCNSEYSRIVTDFYSNQDVSFGTTLISKVIEVPTAKKITEATSATIASLTNRIDHTKTSYEEAYNQVSSSTMAKQYFTQAFGSDVEVLTNTKPVIVHESVSVMVNEKTNNPFSLDSEHWYSQYQIVQEWYLDNNFYMTGVNFTYSPNANNQGSHSLRTVIGRDNGAGRVNTSLPYEEKTWNITVLDSVPATAPNFSLNVANNSPVLNNSFMVDLATGVDLVSCESFSSMAITESPMIPPAGNFNLDCSTSLTQTENISLSDISDGAKTLYLWAMDSSGQISATPKTLSYRKDTTDPTGSFDNVIGAFRGNENISLNFSAADDNEVSSLEIYYSQNAGVNYSLLTTLPAGSTSYTWTTPNDNSSQVRLKVKIIDGANKSIELTTSNFTIDSLAPNPNSITLNSASLTNNNVIAFNVTSCSDTPYVLINEGSAPARTALEWQACSTALGAITYTLPNNTEGSRTLKAWFKDAVGNVSLTSTDNNIIYDITPATLSLTAIPSEIRGGNAQAVTFSQSDINGIASTKLQYAQDGSTFSDVVLNPTSPYTWNIPTHNTSTAKLKLIVVDNAGNSTSVDTISFVIDSTPPLSPNLTLTSAVLTNNVNSTYTALSCSDTPYLLFNEGSQPANNDANWVACTTVANSHAFSFAAVEGVHTIKAWSKDSVGNVSTTSTDFNITYDVTAPTNSLNNLAASVRGGSSTNVIFSQSDTNGIASHKIQYAQDGVNFSDIVSNPTSPYSWSIPTHNTSAARLRLITVDNAGNSNQKTTNSFIIDSTPPSAPVANLFSPAISSSTTVALTVTDCLDRPGIFISESMIAPSENDPAWLTCNTTAGGLSYILVGPVLQGLHNLYVYAKDSVGNISLSTPLSMNYDTVAPTLNLATTLSGSYQGGSTISLTFNTSDSLGISNFRLEYAQDGSTFSTVQTFAANATSYTWTFPSDNTTNARIRLVSVDNAITANTSTVTSGLFTIDSTPPSAPAVTLASAYYSSSTNVTLTIADCADRPFILVNEGTQPTSGAAGWVACSVVVGGTTYTIAATQGTHQLKVWAKDNVGNVSATAANVPMVFDNVLPTINIANNNVAGNSTVPVTFTVTEQNLNNSQNFLVEYHNGTSWSNWNVAAVNGPITNTVFTTNITTPNSENTILTLRVSFTDLAGNYRQSSVQFSTDLTAPIVDAIAINGGALSTANNNVQIALNAHDSLSRVMQFCLRYNNTTKPTANASCWVDVNAPSPGITPNPTISFNNFYYQIGFAKGNYNVYAWVKDEAGQISNNAATLNADRYFITYDPGTPPEFSKAIATNTDAPGNPIGATDLSAPSSSDIYIKWAVTDIEGLAANPINVQYSLNDVDFSDLSGGQNLQNAQNGGCTVDGTFTGCVRLSSPSSSYFKIRVIAKDSAGTTVFFNTDPLNEGKLKILAGNTEHGLDGSARSAVFYNYNSYQSNSYGAKYKLVVSEDGKFFYLDPQRGLLWINPTTGALKVFIPKTGSTSGDGGPVASATLNQANAIVLDHANNLLIWDYNRIRKVNLDTMTINHLVGGGATSNPVVTIDQSDYALPAGFNGAWGTLIPLPNGDLIFSNGATTTHRRYRAIDQKVEPMVIDGVGIKGYPADAWNTLGNADLGIDYNTTTSQINYMVQGKYKSFVGDSYMIPALVDQNSGDENTTYRADANHDSIPWNAKNQIVGLDGRLYLHSRYRAELLKYDVGTNTVTRVLGTGGESSLPCADNTPATSCAVGMDSVFISKSGRIYFIDNGILRTIDDNSNVISLFGQFPSYGDGVLATAARFGNIVDINLGKSLPDNNKIVIEDAYANLFREITFDSNISNLTSACYSWHGPWSFEVDQTDGDILSSCGASVRRYDRDTSAWSTVIGGGGTGYYTASAIGKTGTELNMVSGYNTTTNGIINNKLLYQKYYWSAGVHYGCTIRSYDMSDSYRVGEMMGNANSDCNGTINVGTNLNQNTVAETNISKFRFFQDPADAINKYFFTSVGNNKIYKSNNFGPIELFATLSHNVNSFTQSYAADGLNLYYCATDGFLYKYNYNSGNTYQLPWLSPTIRCKATRNIIYHSGRNSLIMVISQNGLNGIAEYDLNP